MENIYINITKHNLFKQSCVKETIGKYIYIEANYRREIRTSFTL